MRLQPPGTCGCRCDLIKEADDAAFPRYALYVTLGRAMCAHPPPKAEQLQVLDLTLALTLALTRSPPLTLTLTRTLTRCSTTCGRRSPS